MSKYRAEIVAELLQAVRRDVGKGGDGGWLTTVEIAERLSVPPQTARRALYGLFEEGQIDLAAEPAQRNVLSWRLAGIDWDADRGRLRERAESYAKPTVA